MAPESRPSRKDHLSMKGWWSDLTRSSAASGSHLSVPVPSAKSHQENEQARDSVTPRKDDRPPRYSDLDQASASTSNLTTHQSTPARLGSPASGSRRGASPLASRSPSTEPFLLSKKDLWGEAADAIDVETISKWQNTTSDTSLGATARAQSVSVVLNDARNRARSQQNKVWKQRWLSLINSISTFKSLVDEGLRFDPTGYGTLAWSVVSFGLVAAINSSEISEDLTQSCEYIRAIMDEYAMYEARYLNVDCEGRTALERCIVEVYRAILTYVAEMKYYIHHRLGRIREAMRAPSESSFVGLKCIIEERRAAARSIVADIRSELSESDLKTIQMRIDEVLAQDLSRIVKFVDKQEREKVLDWVSGLKIDLVHVTQRNIAEADDRPNAGKWILGHQEYVNWERANTSSSLWLTSGVGTGKTILTSSVVEARAKESSGPMAYFYCSGTPGSNGMETTAEEILKSLLRQFATSSRRGLALIRTQWEELRERRPLTRLEVLDLFSAILEDEQTVEATIIVDGLDELRTENLKKLLDALYNLLKAKNGILKVFASSRWMQRIEDFFRDGCRIDNIADQTQDDMEVYINSVLKAETQARREIEDDLIANIKNTLRMRANGMFRYIELALKYIFDAPTTGRIRERLEDLPLPASGDAVLQPIYQRLYEEIEKEDPVTRLLAHRVIQWLLHQLTPLPTQTLLEAVSSSVGSSVAFKLQRSNPGIDEVKAACHHLVIHNPKSGQFEFGHISVVEFIRWQNTPIFSDVAANSTLAAACLGTLTRQQKSEYGPKEPSFVTYAHVSWAWHWREATVSTVSSDLQDIFNQFWDDDDHLQAFIAYFHEYKSDLDSIWQYDWQWESSRGLYSYNGASKLGSILIKWNSLENIHLKRKVPSSQRWFLACTHGLATAADGLVERQCIDGKSAMFVSGIKLAVAFGNVRLLETMVSKHLNTAQLHGSGTSLLHHAANFRNLQSLQACLEWFPDAINLRSSGAEEEEWDSTPLLMALRSAGRGVQSEDSTFIQVLLEAPKIDLGASDRHGQTALHLALLLEGIGYYVVDALLNKGSIGVFRRDIDGQTQMAVAEKVADHAYLRPHLLQKFRNQADPLHAAARAGDDEAVGKMLSQPNLENGKARTDIISAFLLAAEKGHIECMLLMLRSRKVNVDDQDQDGFSALMLAAINGKDYAVTKLRLQGANVMLETSAGRTALFFAIRKKRMSVLKALLLQMSASPFDINHQDSRTGRTALHYVCEYAPPTEMDWALPSRREILEELLIYNPDVSIRGKDGKMPRDIAAANGFLDLVGLLEPVETTSMKLMQSPATAAEARHDQDAESALVRRAKVHGADVVTWYTFESLKALEDILSNH